MLDGVTLMADVYRPAKPGAYPVVLLRTPYNKAQHVHKGPYFAKRGYALVAQDVRGRYKSEGSFIAWAQERADGIATLDWLTKQPWCNQKIGAWGPSYLGFTSLVLAPSGHPALKAIVNISGPGNVYRTLFPGGSLHLSAIMPWSLVAVNGRSRISPSALQRPIQELMTLTPLCEADKVAGARVPFWQNVVHHPRNAAFWTDMGISKQYGDIRVPMLHITGWNDFVGRHTLEVYNGIRKASPETVQKIHVGSWHHDQAGTNTSQVGEEDFGAQAALDEEAFYQLAIRWFDHYLKGIDNGVERDATATYFVMGRNEWTQSDQWPPRDVRYTDWYFVTGGKGWRLCGRNDARGAERQRSKLVRLRPTRSRAHCGRGQYPFLPLQPWHQRSTGGRAEKRRAGLHVPTFGSGDSDRRTDRGHAVCRHRCCGHGLYRQARGGPR